MQQLDITFPLQMQGQAMGRRGENKIKVPVLTVCYPSSVSSTEGVQQLPLDATNGNFLPEKFLSTDSISKFHFLNTERSCSPFPLKTSNTQIFIQNILQLNGTIYPILTQRIYKQLESNVTVILHLLYGYAAL